MTTARSTIKIPRRSPVFMRRATPVEPSEPVEPAPPSFANNQGTARPRGLTHNPEPITRSLFPFPFPLIYGNMVAIDYIYNEVQE